MESVGIVGIVGIFTEQLDKKTSFVHIKIRGTVILNVSREETFANKAKKKHETHFLPAKVYGFKVVNLTSQHPKEN